MLLGICIAVRMIDVYTEVFTRHTNYRFQILFSLSPALCAVPPIP